MNRLVRWVLLVAALAIATGSMARPALANGSCSQPWLPTHCTTVPTTICIPNDGCYEYEIDINGIWNET